MASNEQIDGGRIAVDHFIDVAQRETVLMAVAATGDELVVRTSVVEVGRSSMIFRQVARPAAEPEALSADARVRAVFIGEGGRPTRIPPEVRAALGA